MRVIRGFLSSSGKRLLVFGLNMSTSLPCPNPTCTHVFTAAAVTGAGSLSCPLCGTVFEFRAGTSSAPPTVPRPTSPASAAPVRTAVSPKETMPAGPLPPEVFIAPPVEPMDFVPDAEPIPTAAPVPSLPEDLGSASSEFKPPADYQSPVRARPPRRSGLRWLILLLLLTALGGIGYGAVQFSPGLKERLNFWEKTEAAGPAFTFPELNCRYVFPDHAWEKDDPLKTALKASIARKRADPDAWMAFAAKDYKKSTPDAGKAVEDAVLRLNGFFEGLEWEQKDDVVLGEQRAQRLVFLGQAGGDMKSGECIVLAHKGIVYWLILWTSADSVASDRDRIGAEFNKLRAGFALRGDRENWKDARRVKNFNGKKAPYELRDVPELCEEWNAKDMDPAADIYLVGKDPEEPRNTLKYWNLMVLLLKKPADLKTAVDEAKAHILAQHKKDYPQSTMEVLTDKEKKPLERDGPIGNSRGRILKLFVKNGDNRERLLVLAVVLSEELDRVLVIQCECEWKRRERWEAIFQQLLIDFRLHPAKKE